MPLHVGRLVVSSAAVCGAVAGGAVGLTGCSSSALPPAADALTTASVPAPARTVGPVAGPGQLTGRQLMRALLPGSAFPAGYTPDAQRSVDTGGTLELAPARCDLTTIACPALETTVSGPGFGETAMASGGYQSPGPADGAGRSGYGQFVYQFATPAQAVAFFSGIRAAAARCSSFTTMSQGATMTVSCQVAPAAPVDAYQAFEVTQTGTLSSPVVSQQVAGQHVVTQRTLFTLAGSDVFGAGFAAGNGAVPQAGESTASLAAELITRVQALG